MAEEVRVTTQAEVFDDHFESHQFMSPGGSLFEEIACARAGDSEEGKSAGEGKVWMIEDRATGTCRFMALRGGQVERCDGLAQMLEAVSDESLPSPLPNDRLGQHEEVRTLA